MMKISAVKVILLLTSTFVLNSSQAYSADEEDEVTSETIIVEQKPKKQKGGGGGGCVSCGNITITVTNPGNAARVNYKVDRPNKMTNDEKALFQRCKELLSVISNAAVIAGVRKFEFENNVGDNPKNLYMEARDERKAALAEYDAAGCNSFLDPQLPELVNTISETDGYNQ